METDVGIAAWRTFLTAHARVTALLEDELQRERELPLTWYDVLLHLREAPERRLRMTELAAAVLLSKSGLTRLVDRMYAAGLVNRSPDGDDRRGRWVMLTPQGKKRLREAGPVHVRGINRHFIDYLTPEAAQGMTEALARIVEAAESER
ncbi:MAG: MarR family transcriptional regulator [Dehalococcoidia bacterium]|nr:MarR family transcriptional regulator [Dehalococcoidia bacterium]